MDVIIGRFDAALQAFLSTPMPSEKRVQVTEQIPVALVRSVVYDPEFEVPSSEVIQAN